MSQRNRIVLAALALVAAVALATPAPARAAGFPTGRFPAVDALERAWTWIAHLVTGETKRPATMQEKEGGMINPNGGSTPGMTVPPPPPILSGNGGGGK